MNATERALAAQAESPTQKQTILWWLLAATLAVAFLMRLARLDVLPPGLYYDEAFNGVDARNVVEGLSRPLYFFANNGREPLFIYWQALWVALLGPTAYALRLAAALVGSATIVVIFWGARTLLVELTPASFATPAARQRIAGWLALVAAAGVAISYWHLSVSRLGFRTNLLPLVSMVAVVFFWRGWQRGRGWDFAWAGLWLGLAFYTYTAARLLPLVVVLFVAVELILDLARWLRGRRSGAASATTPVQVGVDRTTVGTSMHRVRTRGDGHDASMSLPGTYLRPAGLAGDSSREVPSFSHHWLNRFRNLALLAGVGLVCLAPLLVEAARHPELLSARTADVSIFTAAQVDMPGTPVERFVHNVGAVAAGFYTLGDENPRHNLPGRPFNDWLQAILFTLGWLALFWWLRRPAARLVLIWFAVMATPMLFSTQAPHALRATGLLPPLAVLYGVGGGVIAGWLGRRWAPVRVAGLLAVVLLVVSGGLTAYDYFVRWAQLPELGVAFDADYQGAAAATAAALHADPDTPVLLPRALFETPQMRFAVGPLPLGTLPAAGETLPTARYLGAAALTDAAAPAAAWRYLGLPLMDARWQAAGAFDDAAVAALYAGQPSYLLRAEDGRMTATAVKAECGVENAECGVGAIGAAGLTSQPAWPGIVSTSLLSPTVQPFQPRYRLDQAFANGLRLVGYDVQPDRVEPEDGAPFFLLTTYWLLPAGPPFIPGESPDQFAHLILPDGQSQDNSPPGNTYLPSLWTPGQVVQSRRLLPVPPGAAPGKAIFETGLFFQQPDGSSARVDLIDGNGQVGGDSLRFGPVMVGQAAPVADLTGLTPGGATFDGTVTLAAWQATRGAADPGLLNVDLAWQSLDRVATDYTAFVHVIDDSGQILAQGDQPPGGPGNPTSHWAPGETVRMSLQLALPPGAQRDDLRLRVGLYEPVGGRQLPITACTLPAGACDATFVLLPLP